MLSIRPIIPHQLEPKHTLILSVSVLPLFKVKSAFPVRLEKMIPRHQVYQHWSISSNNLAFYCKLICFTSMWLVLTIMESRIGGSLFLFPPSSGQWWFAYNFAKSCSFFQNYAETKAQGNARPRLRLRLEGIQFCSFSINFGIHQANRRSCFPISKNSYYC